MRRSIVSLIPALALLACAAPAAAASIGSQAADALHPATELVLVQHRGGGGGGSPPAVVQRSAPPVVSRVGPGSGNYVRRGDGDRGGYRGGNYGYRGTRYLWGPGVAFYFYDGYYHGDCSWLRRKAQETGSAYWHRRLRQCRNA